LLPIQKSAAENYVVVESKISSQTISLPIQKSIMKNYVAVDSEIDSRRLCCCRLRNRQPKTVTLPIQKSTAKLYHCRVIFGFNLPSFLFFSFWCLAAKLCDACSEQFSLLNCVACSEPAFTVELCSL
jgi:hypothetical protein